MAYAQTDESDVADYLLEGIEAAQSYASCADDYLSLDGFTVTRDETGLVLTSPEGDVFRVVVVQVSP